MATEVDLGNLGSKTGQYVDSLKSDVYSKIGDLESLLNSITAYGDMGSDFFAEITDISFDNIQKAEDIISNVSYVPIPTRDLLPDDSSPMEKGHIFISSSLDNMESNLISMLTAAGNENIKDISSAFLSDEDIFKIESSYFEYRQSISNKYSILMSKYITADTTANIDWLADRDEFIDNDFRKDLYSELFKLAQGTTDFLAKNAIKIEELHANFTSSNNNLLNKLVNANVAAYKAEVKANISVLENDLKKSEAKVDINTLKYEATKGELELKLRQETDRISAYTKHYAQAMSETTSSFDTNISTSKAVSASYEAVLASHSQRYSGVVLGRQNVK